MIRRPSPWPLLAASCLVLAGCEDVPLGPELGLPGPRTSLPSARPSAAPQRTDAPTTTLPRATTERADDESGFQVKLFHVVPADGDETLDDAGALAESALAMNRWFDEQTGGHRLRLDTQGGAPDMTFFRSKQSAAALAAMGRDVISAIDDEVRAAGFNHPMKLHAYYYGGPVQLTNAKSLTLGVGGSGRAMVFLRQFDADRVDDRVRGVGVLEWTMAHEIVHALGFVGTCAPNEGQDAHVLDDTTDLMHPAAQADTYPVLDVGNNDYFRHGKADCADLGQNAYFEPLFPTVVPPSDAPSALSAGPGALPVSPVWTAASFEGRPAIEQEVLARLNQARSGVGKPAWRVHPALAVLARRQVQQYASAGLEGADPLGLDEQLKRAGYVGSLRSGGVSIPIADETDEAAIAAIDDAMGTGLAEAFDKLAMADGDDTGVGAWIADGKVHLAYLAGASEYEFSALAIGEGPFDTYTLSGKARLKAGKQAPEVRVRVGDQLYRTGTIAPGNDWFDFAASIPRRGMHEISLMGRQEGNRFSGPVGLFKIDGDQPLAKAVVSAPASIASP